MGKKQPKPKSAKMGGYKGRSIVGARPDRQRELQSKLDQLMIRRKKSDVLDLPEKQRIQVVVEFSEEQRAMYQAAKVDNKIILPDGSEHAVENALERALRLKQICGTTATILGPEHDSSLKLDRAVEMCQALTANGEHVVVFSQFLEVMAAMQRRLTKVKVPVMVMNGTTVPDTSTRSQFVKRWGTQKEPTVLIAGLQVAGVGLNMTYTSKCIFLDKLWVPKLNEQAEDRLHRIGASKTQPIQIYHIIVKGSIEQRIESILKQKEKLFNSIVEESEWKKALAQALADEEIAA